MTTTGNTWQAHAARLADQLVESGDIRDSGWAKAVAATPRHLLVPVAYRQRPDGPWQRLDDDFNLVYSPVTLVTAVEDGIAVSSSTKPDLMVRMLETLDVGEGQRVLEIGTGTGYNAALLSHRLGDDHVFSVDVDAGLVDPARARLASIGRHPRLATRDGATGWPEHAPYDRIIATCSVRHVPWAWAEQLALGGTLLVDVKLGNGAGNLVRLHRRPDRLEGRFTGRFAAFMDMRAATRVAAPSAPRRPRAEDTRERTSSAPAQPWNTHREVWMLACLTLPAEPRRGFVLDPDTRNPTASTLAAPDGSWAEVDLMSGRVREAGATPLWERVETAYQRWHSWGEPSWERFGLTATAAEQYMWLDDPGSPNRWSIDRFRGSG